MPDASILRCMKFINIISVFLYDLLTLRKHFMQSWPLIYKPVSSYLISRGYYILLFKPFALWNLTGNVKFKLNTTLIYPKTTGDFATERFATGDFVPSRSPVLSRSSVPCRPAPLPHRPPGVGPIGAPRRNAPVACTKMLPASIVTSPLIIFSPSKYYVWRLSVIRNAKIEHIFARWIFAELCVNCCAVLWWIIVWFLRTHCIVNWQFVWRLTVNKNQKLLRYPIFMSVLASFSVHF